MLKGNVRDTAGLAATGAQGEAAGGDSTGGSGAAALHCLSSNISIQTASTQHRKAASALGWNVICLAQKHGLENLGFLTLTFKDHVTCVKGSAAPFELASLQRHQVRYQDYIGVLGVNALAGFTITCLW